MPSREAFICAALRTAGGRPHGRLSRWHPADLGGLIIDAVLDRTGLAPAAVEDVIFGCVTQIGPQTSNVGRTCVMSSSLPDTVPGVTLDRQCGSSLQAASFAAQAVMSGTHDVVIAGGVENMSMAPMFAGITVAAAHGMPGPFTGERISARYPGEEFSQFIGAERVGGKYGVTRDEMLDFAESSHVRALAATAGGRFTEEIVGVPIEAPEGRAELHLRDEGMREPNRAKMESLDPLVPGGIITAAMASQVCDGASAILVASERAIAEHGLTPLARFHTMTVVGSDPRMVLEGPIPATRALLHRAGLDLPDIDLYEVNEAFGTIPLAWCRAVDGDRERLNVNGGAQALGHPLGATGTKLIATLVHELRRRRGRYGLIAICEGLGTANATLIEAL